MKYDKNTSGATAIDHAGERGASENISDLGVPRADAKLDTGKASRDLATDAGTNAWAAAGDALYWFIPAFVAMYAKYVILVPGRGLAIVKRAIFNTASPTEFGVGHWRDLSFFRMDLLVGCILIPVAYFVIAIFLPRKWSSRIAWLSSVAVALMMYIQIGAMETTGSYISLHTLGVAASWGIREPMANLSFLGWGTAVLLCTLAASSLLTTNSFRKLSFNRAGTMQPSCAGKVSKGFELVVCFLVLIVTALSWAPIGPITVFHRSTMLTALRAYLDAGPVESGDAKKFEDEMAALTIPQLEQRYRDLVHAPAPTRDANYWAKARGYNVIFFILETTPTRFLDATGNLDGFPNLKRLREQSFLPVQHYTTFPVTHRALYSLFGSLYPSPSDLSLPEKHVKVALPGMFRSLSAHGYQTAAYMPFRWNGEYDDEMFHILGVNHLAYPDAAVFNEVVGSSNSGMNWRQARVQRDREALALMEKDLSGWLAQHTSYAAVFLPQVGHVPLPLPDIAGQTGEGEVLSREKEVLQMEDAWLGDILQLLELHHELDHTLIVVTGDHGIRVANEDPIFKPGLVDDYSFRVPLLIYAPGVLTQTKWIPWVTSHIDVPPTLLDLLGIDGGRELMEGSPIWNTDISARSTYFFASRLLGVDGYHTNGQFFMLNQQSDFSYSSSQLHFDILDPLPQYSGRSSKVVESISHMSSLQKAMEDKLASSYPSP